MQELEKSLNEVHVTPQQHIKVDEQRQKRSHDLRAQQHSYNVGVLVSVRDGRIPAAQAVTASCPPPPVLRDPAVIPDTWITAGPGPGPGRTQRAPVC